MQTQLQIMYMQCNKKNQIKQNKWFAFKYKTVSRCQRQKTELYIFKKSKGRN